MRDGMKLLRRGGDTVCYVLRDERCAEFVTADMTIVSVPVNDWNGQLSPWAAPACFRNGGDFGGGAGEYIAALADMIPLFEKENGIMPRRRFIAGYSLAGLCAVYALYCTDAFDGAASASGSMWYDGWLEFMKANAPCGRAVYLSVGEREKRTRNARLAAVEDSTRAASEILDSAGLKTEFVLEKGDHFTEPEARLARGIDRLCAMLADI